MTPAISQIAETPPNYSSLEGAVTHAPRMRGQGTVYPLQPSRIYSTIESEARALTEHQDTYHLSQLTALLSNRHTSWADRLERGVEWLEHNKPALGADSLDTAYNLLFAAANVHRRTYGSGRKSGSRVSESYLERMSEVEGRIQDSAAMTYVPAEAQELTGSVPHKMDAAADHPREGFRPASLEHTVTKGIHHLPDQVSSFSHYPSTSPIYTSSTMALDGEFPLDDRYIPGSRFQTTASAPKDDEKPSSTGEAESGSPSSQEGTEGGGQGGGDGPRGPSSGDGGKRGWGLGRKLLVAGVAAAALLGAGAVGAWYATNQEIKDRTEAVQDRLEAAFVAVQGERSPIYTENEGLIKGQVGSRYTDGGDYVYRIDTSNLNGEARQRLDDLIVAIVRASDAEDDQYGSGILSSLHESVGGQALDKPRDYTIVAKMTERLERPISPGIPEARPQTGPEEGKGNAEDITSGSPSESPGADIALVTPQRYSPAFSPPEKPAPPKKTQPLTTVVADACEKGVITDATDDDLKGDRLTFQQLDERVLKQWLSGQSEGRNLNRLGEKGQQWFGGFADVTYNQETNELNFTPRLNPAFPEANLMTPIMFTDEGRKALRWGEPLAEPLKLTESQERQLLNHHKLPFTFGAGMVKEDCDPEEGDVIHMTMSFQYLSSGQHLVTSAS